MSTRGVHRDDMYDDPTIAAFARDLQDAAATTPAPAVGASLAAVLEGRAPAAVYPEVVAPRSVRPARRSLRLRWAVASAAFGIGASSLGIAGALPGPVQRQVSRMADVIGVDLPDGSEDGDTTPTTPTEPILPPSTVVVPRPTVVPPRPSVVPPHDRPVPSTVPEGSTSDGRGRGDASERGAGRQHEPAADVEDLDDERNGPRDAEDELGEDRGGSTETGTNSGGPSRAEGTLRDGEDDLVERSVSRRSPSLFASVHHQD